MAKVIAISKDKQYYKIGESSTESLWYGVGEKIKNFIDSVNRGDEEEIKYDEAEDKGRKQRVLNFIRVTKKAPETPTSSPTTTSRFNNGNDRNKSIEKQTIVKAAVEAVKAMTGQFQTKEELGEAVLHIYNKLITNF
jgi:hypothetical protein